MGHNYIGRSYMGHNYIGRSYMGHNYIGHSYMGHNLTDHTYIRHDYIPVQVLSGPCVGSAEGVIVPTDVIEVTEALQVWPT